MKFSFIKKIRVALSLIFFSLTAVLFLDFTNSLQPDFFSSILYIQFIPSVIKFITLLSFTVIGFLLVLLLTLLFGRIYCSSICPLGTLQDILSFIIRKIKKKKYYHLSKEQKYLRYLILAGAIITTASGLMLLVNLLDPFSNFGKILTGIFRPLIIILNNVTAYSFEGLGIYLIYPYEFKGINVVNLIYPLIFLLTIIILVYKNGRLFCNTLCPVGTLLGFVSKFSIIKIKINEENCRSCRLCERVCKGGCIDKTAKTIDFSRCISCYNCFTVCPTEGIIFENIFKKKEINKKEFVNKGKRKFLLKTSSAILLLAGINFSQVKPVPKKRSTIPIKINYPVSPPGSISLEHFNERCNSCHLCISVCPTQVLQPSLLEYGLAGLFQPVMDFQSGFCNYECKLCTDVCPTGSITALTLEMKKTVQMGKAKFIKENCIVHTENTACGACAEHCPTKAVIMVPYKGIHIPEVSEEYCTGCGACEFPCPTIPYKAIYVEGNPVHLAAKKKPVEKLKQTIEEDFPF